MSGDAVDFIEAVREAAALARGMAYTWSITGWGGGPQVAQYNNLAARMERGLERLIEGALGPEDAKLVRETCLANMEKSGLKRGDTWL